MSSTKAKANTKPKGKSSRAAWPTKYGLRRVRHEAPTLEEAVAAARGLSDRIEDQVEIASALIGLPSEQVRAEVLKSMPRKDTTTLAFSSGRSGAPRAVVVERKPARRLVAGARRTFDLTKSGLSR